MKISTLLLLIGATSIYKSIKNDEAKKKVVIDKIHEFIDNYKVSLVELYLVFQEVWSESRDVDTEYVNINVNKKLDEIEEYLKSIDTKKIINSIDKNSRTLIKTISDVKKEINEIPSVKQISTTKTKNNDLKTKKVTKMTNKNKDLKIKKITKKTSKKNTSEKKES